MQFLFLKYHKIVVSVLQEDGEELYDKHVAEWQKLHQQAHIEIEGNLKVVCLFKNH